MNLSKIELEAIRASARGSMRYAQPYHSLSLAWYLTLFQIVTTGYDGHSVLLDLKLNKWIDKYGA